MRGSGASSRTERIAILPLRNSVLFPMSVVPINVGRPRSVRLVEELLGRRERPGRRAHPAQRRNRRADVRGPLLGRHPGARGQGHSPRPLQLQRRAERPRALPRGRAAGPRALHARRRRAHPGAGAVGPGVGRAGPEAPARTRGRCWRCCRTCPKKRPASSTTCASRAPGRPDRLEFSGRAREHPCAPAHPRGVRDQGARAAGARRWSIASSRC